MKINLKQLPSGAEPMEVRADLDLSQLSRWGEHPLTEPVLVQAVFRNKNGVVTVDYTASLVLQGSCARCLEPVKRPVSMTFSHTLVEQVEDEKSDSFIIVPNAQLDLTDLVRADISLELTDVLLCDEDCKGMCPQCGANRNLTDCGCGAQFTDPRFDKLRALLEN